MMKFGKGDVVHTVDRDENGMQRVGIVVDVDHKKRLYAVQTGKTIDDAAWYSEKEVW